MCSAKDEEIMTLKKDLKQSRDNEILIVKRVTMSHQLEMERISGEIETVKKRFSSKCEQV